MMEKNGRIELGKTPSEQSGKPAEVIKENQVLTKEETPVQNTVEKVASVVDN